MTAFHRIGLVGRPAGAQALETVRRLQRFLEGRGVCVVLERNLAQRLDASESMARPIDALNECDLVIVVGGDGSLLGAARALFAGQVALLGINRGSLGFLTDIHPDELEECVGEVLDGQYVCEQRMLLEVEGWRGEQRIGKASALNDVVLHPTRSTRMLEFELYIDDLFVCIQRADGLIMATPTGSTAYALSAGGPILYPQLDALLIVPMYPHTLSSRPIVVGGSSVLKVVIAQDHGVVPSVSCDGQDHFLCKPGDTLIVRKRVEPLRLIHPIGHDFYEACRTKLGWGGHHGRCR